MNEAAQRAAKAILAKWRQTTRQIVALAGPPASGKSTVAEQIVEGLVAQGKSATVMPMDGFHLDNRVLDQRNLRSRKGCPESFDADGFIATIERIRKGGDVVIPTFDRALDMSIAGAHVVEADCEIIVVEGNYLLFSEAPWCDLADLWDYTIWLDVPEAVLKERLFSRWLGFGLDAEAALARAESNDLPNARRVLKARLPSDMTI